jgi:Tc toxin complex TcA C-terminal TcB-binding domain
VANSVSDYVERTGEDDRFRTRVIPVNAIATSSSQNDGGVFELSFRNERYSHSKGRESFRPGSWNYPWHIVNLTIQQ